MTSTIKDLEAHYRAYIDAINAGRTHHLEDFVQDELLYNGKPMTKTEYQNLIAECQAGIRNLYFDIQMLVVSNDQVGCRLWFANCTPEMEFLGNHPSGKTISFAEHVFYKFRDGKIYEVWSMLDETAVAAGMK